MRHARPSRAPHSLIFASQSQLQAYHLQPGMVRRSGRVSRQKLLINSFLERHCTLDRFQPTRGLLLLKRESRLHEIGFGLRSAFGFYWISWMAHSDYDAVCAEMDVVLAHILTSFYEGRKNSDSMAKVIAEVVFFLSYIDHHNSVKYLTQIRINRVTFTWHAQDTCSEEMRSALTCGSKGQGC